MTTLTRTLILLLTLAAWAGGAHADVRWGAAASLEGLTPEQQRAVEALRGIGCAVRPPTTAEAARVATAAAHAAGALADPATRAAAVSRRDLIVEDGPAWRHRPGAAAEALALLAAAPPVAVVIFEGCGGRGDEANALTVVGAPLIALWGPALQGEAPSIARTLVHETLHTVGYTHPEGAADLWGAVYNRTVPVFLGCLTETWPAPDPAACARPGRQPVASR